MRLSTQVSLTVLKRLFPKKWVSIFFKSFSTLVLVILAIQDWLFSIAILNRDFRILWASLWHVPSGKRERGRNCLAALHTQRFKSYKFWYIWSKNGIHYCFCTRNFQIKNFPQVLLVRDSKPIFQQNKQEFYQEINFYFLKVFAVHICIYIYTVKIVKIYLPLNIGIQRPIQRNDCPNHRGHPSVRCLFLGFQHWTKAASQITWWRVNVRQH